MIQSDLQIALDGFSAIEEGMLTIEAAGMTSMSNATSPTQRRFILSLKRLYFAYKAAQHHIPALRKELELPSAGQFVEATAGVRDGELGGVGSGGESVVLGMDDPHAEDAPGPPRVHQI